jgi:hypothetical protein
MLADVVILTFYYLIIFSACTEIIAINPAQHKFSKR